MYTRRTQIWLTTGLFNLAIVALYGSLMRYKIAFDFPLLEQKNLLHAHSHFAFSGWITHVLYVLLLSVLSPYLSPQQQKAFSRLINFNLLCCFGMLLAFTVQGYQFISIAFSTLTIVTAAIFAWFYIKASRKMHHHPARNWAVAGLVMNVLSSAGPFTLAYIMATKTVAHELYLASIYYYLHFQYNGWFFFGTMAIIAAQIPAERIGLNRYFRLFLITVIPTFFLSVLWARLPDWLYLVTLAATLVQAVAWFTLVGRSFSIVKNCPLSRRRRWTSILFIAATIAMSVKFLLQSASVVPSLSQLVFGFRPIVIAYLHLILLGVYSLFLIGFIFARGYLPSGHPLKISAYLFLIGVFLNELLLAIQGIGAFAYVPVPNSNEMLFVAAVILLGSSTALAVFSLRKINQRKPFRSHHNVQTTPE